MTYLSDKVVKTRKRHWCTICDMSIQKGETCHTYAGVGDDGLYRIYFHPMCWSYSMRWSEYDWGCFCGGASKREMAMEIIAGEY